MLKHNREYRNVGENANERLDSVEILKAEMLTESEPVPHLLRRFLVNELNFGLDAG